jgi:hypothetical protein
MATGQHDCACKLGVIAAPSTQHSIFPIFRHWRGGIVVRRKRVCFQPALPWQMDADTTDLHNRRRRLRGAHAQVRNIRLSLARMQRSMPSHKTEFPSTWFDVSLQTIGMSMRFVIRPLCLATGQLIQVSDGEGLAVKCLEGSLWITQSNDTRDVALTAGQAFVLDKPGLALICAAAGPATLAIERPSRPPPLTPYFWSMRNAAGSLSRSRDPQPAEGARREQIG